MTVDYSKKNLQNASFSNEKLVNTSFRITAMNRPTSNPRGKWLAATIVTLGVTAALVALKYRRLDPRPAGGPPRATTLPANPPAPR